jgi:hypothetical protein
MCVEDKIIKELENEKQDILEAVQIIKDFGPDVKAIRVMLDDHKKRIDEEVLERKEENKRITSNYLKRFEKIEILINCVNKGINTKFKDFVIDMKNELKSTNKLIISLFVTIFIMFMGSTIFVVLNNIFKWITI